ncbi:hypothetical protein B7Y94_05910 [Candidatus Saccharibacteria bacterium 32-49-12]|nr:MAG: hypothetical protein B7Y94_05910 [Candidatus Saccharibacteria bacterium 32-49-12]
MRLSAGNHVVMIEKQLNNSHNNELRSSEKALPLRKRLLASVALSLAGTAALSGCADQGIEAAPVSPEVTSSAPVTVETTPIESSAEPSTTTSETAPAPEVSESPEAADWEFNRFELPPPDEKGTYRFESDEQFLDWVEMKPDDIKTSEDLARKYVLNVQTLATGGINTQPIDYKYMDIANFSGEDGNAETIKRLIGDDIAERFLTPGADETDFVGEKAREIITDEMIGSLINKEDIYPLAYKYSYVSSKELYINGSDFADSTSVKLEVVLQLSDNVKTTYRPSEDPTTTPIVEMRIQSGFPVTAIETASYEVGFDRESLDANWTATWAEQKSHESEKFWS